MEDVHRCPDCTKMFSQRQVLNRHRQKYCAYLKCAECQRHFSSVYLLREHKKSCKSPKVCDLCLTTFGQRSDMLYHQRTSCKNRAVLEIVDAKTECSGCQREFVSRKNLIRHEKYSCPAIKKATFVCDKCKKTFTNKESLYTHIKRHINIAKRSIRCTDCDEAVPKSFLQKHKREVCVNRGRIGGRIRRYQPKLPEGVIVAATAFNKMLNDYEIRNENEPFDIVVYLETQRYTIQEIIKHDLFFNDAIKMNMVLQIQIENVAGQLSSWAFRTSNMPVYLATPIDDIITDMFENIKQKFSERLLDGSGCKMTSIEKLLVRTSKNNPLRTSNYVKIPYKRFKGSP